MDVSIVSPEEKVWQGEADLVVARSPEGEFGIMRGHIPFLAALVPGRVRVVSGSDSEEFFVPGGFLEASGPMDDYHVIVLADDADNLADMNVSEARERLEEARRQNEREQDDRTQARLQIELARVEIAESRGQ
ncbi:MAG: ATP synthase F1 subunit epsilon [Actinomycetota bacterium]|nr:ATP synthase F1 subunit epsilon [Actinomycetota bacterium]